ncbi:hypothetical protein [Chelativorans sp. AA-79]|uniref:hypothetical protein n=1 Tax=Chelativorans sp. AA-79 TaxID=3028735 RepID=UPI0023F902C1|nr:hypothetical protein [Chelativorans sp. AA-79]WEX09248.1 hypothetical protein PVE73_25005 [Chelativorans sp. AA-79]
MRRILIATSALVLLGAGSGLAQEYQTDRSGDTLPPDLATNQGVDTTVTTGSIEPLRPLSRGYQATEAFRPSDENDLPPSLTGNTPFDEEIDPGTMTSASPILRPLAGQETETFSARDENLPEPELAPGR